MTSEPARVSYRVESGIADVRLNRPSKLNALDREMFEALVATADRLEHDHTVRVVILSGEGDGFSAGLDVSMFQRLAENATGTAAGSDAAAPPIGVLGQRAASVWADLPVPVIAAMHGVALGGGLQIALGADIRIVAPDTRLSFKEIHWGLVPDMTATQVLPELVGRDIAKELVFTGRVVSGSEAVALGLATTVAAEPRITANELARAIAEKSPHAIRHAKKLLNLAGRVDFNAGLDAERSANQDLLRDPRFAESLGTAQSRILQPPRS
jgi:enoyl-CoA hydratase/carnithine racemase